MHTDDYREFTRRLAERVARDDRVFGLVAVGSMAERDYAPDEWSDHDFFLIVREGAQEAFRTDPSWLPEVDEVAFWFRETEHGVKVVYRSGHLLEFAVFDERELYLAKVNRYRVLVDRGGIEAHMRAVVEATLDVGRREPPTDAFLFGQFLTNLLVGAGRHRRGEALSGAQFVKASALRHLAILVAKHVPAEHASLLDNLDPFRRFDLVYPEIAAEIVAILEADTLDAARRLLELSRRVLGAVPCYPHDAVEVVSKCL